MNRDETVALFLECEKLRGEARVAALAESKGEDEAENIAHEAAKAHWNAWAKSLLAQRQSMEAAGVWKSQLEYPRVEYLRDLEKGETAESQTWLNNAFTDFSRCLFLVEAEESEQSTVEKGVDATAQAPIQSVRFEVASIDFSGFVFPGDASFANTTFSGLAEFGSASFSNVASFESATFLNDAHFQATTFSGWADFQSAAFSGNANFGAMKLATYFRATIFSGCADFQSATFSGSANFESAAFSNIVDFGRASFSGSAVFAMATFSHKTDFGHVSFAGPTSFSQARFSTYVEFGFAAFSGDTDFGYTRFSGIAHFASANFHGNAIFGSLGWDGEDNGATFSGDAHFHNTTFSGDTEFHNVTFCNGAYFLSAAFCGPTHFRNAAFSGTAYFENAIFQKNTDFDQTVFNDGAEFKGVKVERAFDMMGAKFAKVPSFSQADFKQAPDLDAVQFPLPSFWRRGELRFIPLYRAIRRMAIQSADHEREQMAFKGEVRCKRGHEHKPWHTGFWFGIAYDALSDFGRSIARPLAIWLASGLAFAAVYLWNAGEAVPGWLSPCAVDGASKALKAATLSAANALPLIGSSRREVAAEFYKCLALPHAPAWSPILQIWQTLWSAVLLFLFLLALRNQFKIK